MHEFSMAASIRDVVLEEARRHRACGVREVRCRVGAMRQVVPELLRSAFSACCDGTAVAGARLILESEPIRLACKACGADEDCQEVVFVCPQCASADIQLAGGEALEIVSLNIDRE